MCMGESPYHNDELDSLGDRFKQDDREAAIRQVYGRLPRDRGFPTRVPTTPGMSSGGSDVNGTGSAYKVRGENPLSLSTDTHVAPMYADQNDRAKVRADEAQPFIEKLMTIFRLANGRHGL